MVERGLPAWPTRSLVDPVSVRAVLSMLLDEMFMCFAGRAIEKQDPLQCSEKLVSSLDNVAFNRESWDSMWSHVQGSPEEEVVGVLLGKFGSHETTVLGTAEMINVSSNPRSFYEVDPVEMCKIWNTVDAMDCGETVVGFYHSHPRSSAQPSSADWDLAHPGYSYVICSLKDMEARTFSLGSGVREVRPNGRQ